MEMNTYTVVFKKADKFFSRRFRDKSRMTYEIIRMKAGGYKAKVVPYSVYSRHNIYMRDRKICQYCGKHRRLSELSIDHVMPRAQGGGTTWENIVTCCLHCNCKKGNRTPKQANMPLLKKPRKPTYKELLKGVWEKGVWHDA